MSPAFVFWLVIAPFGGTGGLTTIPVPYDTQEACAAAAHNVNEDNKIPWNLRHVGFCAIDALSLRASPTDGELVERLWDEINSHQFPTDFYPEEFRGLIEVAADVAYRLSTQGKRLAELETDDVKAAELLQAAVEDFNDMKARAEAAESALSTAEARGLERAAKWHDAHQASMEKLAVDYDREGRNDPAVSALHWATHHRISAAAIRALSTNEAGK